MLPSDSTRWFFGIHLGVIATMLGLGCSSGGGGSSSSGDGGPAPTEPSSSTSSSSGGTSSGGSTSTSSSTSSSSGSSGAPADPKRATCEAYADLIVRCCNPPVPQCGPERRDGWVDFCMKGYDSCKAAYDCLAKATCESRSACPNFGSGCM